ncbi:Ribose transport system permease protein RbsC [Symmachiella macrocystis]|uniref:Ribose transport system permease protein RbsC n=1 Tax=Symmachiella macrocystis TaxID=2527985 RepID=A0A5C6BRC5_9PLAN|nr:ABC transporter permease [Symmachiella macrocystis]TWU14598.1 Ribose transport system permease protein RbsC [Symmachiella macrocystis]
MTELEEKINHSVLSRFSLRDFAPLISLFVIVMFFTLTNDEFLSFGRLRLVLQQGAVLAIVSTGLTFVLLCAEIDLSVGMLALWTACACGVLYEQPFAAGEGGQGDISVTTLVVVIVVPLVSSLLLGLISGLLTVSSRLPSFIITLAMMNIADGLSKTLTQSEKFSVPEVLKEIGNGRLRVTDDFYLPYSAILAAAVMILGHLVLQHTRFGRYVYMTGGNREAARLAGVRTGWIVIACLAICAVTAGLGGLVNAGRLGSVTLDQNGELLLSAVACVVLGGTSLFGGEGGIGRTVIGVLTFSVLGVGLSGLISQVDFLEDRMRPLLMGVVLMTALVINGFLSRKSG